MANEYDALAEIYDRLGMADFALRITPRLLTYAQQNEWAGRQIIDIGCGTGAVARWYGSNRPRIQVHGIDYSPAMLNKAQALFQEQGMSGDLTERDILNIADFGTVDMVTAFDVINEMSNLRDLGTVFENVSTILPTSKWFVFDLHTTEGLAHAAQTRDELILNEDDLVVYATSIYNYERQSYTRDFIIFQHIDEQWHRTLATREIRAYPVQAIATLLRRNGFEIRSVVNERLQDIDAGSPGNLRVVFIAEKQ